MDCVEMLKNFLIVSALMNRAKMNWLIRPASSEDASAIRDLLTKSYQNLLQPDYGDDVLTKALPLITEAREDLLTCGTWYVAQHPDTNQIVGCGGWTRLSPMSNVGTPDEEGMPHLRHFACDPEWTRTGIASAIWQRSIRDMANSYGKVPSLEVFSTLTAIPFYQSLGFEKVNPVNIPLNQGACMFPAMLMNRGSGSK